MLHFAEKAELHINIKIKQTIGEIRVRNISIVINPISSFLFAHYSISNPKR